MIVQLKPPVKQKQEKKPKEKQPRTLNENSLLSNQKFLLYVFIFIVVLSVFITITFILDNKKVITRKNYSIVYGSLQNDPNNKNSSETNLEKFGIETNMHKGTNNKYICSNCGKTLTNRGVDDYIMVITQKDSFVKVFMCEECFSPVGELLSSIGKK